METKNKIYLVIVMITILIYNFCTISIAINEEKILELQIKENEIREKLSTDFNNAELHVELGRILRDLGKLEESINECNKAIEIDPENLSFILSRAVTYMGMKEDDKAIDDLNLIINKDPKRLSAYLNLSVIYRNKGDYDKAIVYCTVALGIKEDSDIYYELGTIYMKKGDKDKAREMFSKVISIEGHDSISSELALSKLEELRALEPKPTGPALDYKGYIPSEEEAVEVALAWLAIVDNEQYEESWESAADYLKNVIPKEDWVQSLKGVRTRMGKVTSRELKAKEYTRTLIGAPDGDYVVIQYETSFDNKQYAVETITPMLDKDGKWRVSSYYIR